MIRLFLFFAVGCVLAMPITAQEYPALHDVVGVAGNDVLNIRQSPNASSPIVGSIGPYQTRIEVVASEQTGKWGLINVNETSGWVSLRFMARAPQGYWLDLEQNLFCFGTEPFWSLSQGSSHVFFDLNGQETAYSLLAIGRSASKTGRAGFTAVTSAVNRSSINGFIAAQSCSDGMSDRQYGISIDLMLQKNANLKMLSGCCSLQH